MNIVQNESPFIIETKIGGCKNKKGITYSFIESSHSLCIDRKDIILAQIQACERLLDYTKEEMDISEVNKEISILKISLGLI